MNLVKDLVARIEKRLTETKSPCKLYATEKVAESIAETFALEFAQYFARDPSKAHPARYIVVHIPSVDKYTVGFDLSELMSRSTHTGGYVGIVSASGFYSF